MGLFIFGMLIVAASFFVNQISDYRVRKARPLILLGGILVMVIGFASAAFKQVEPGEVGVQTLFGKVQDHVLHSGLHIVNPLVEITTFPIKTQNYTMSGIMDEGDKMGDDAIRVLTADGLEVVIDLTVLYRIIPERAPEILSKIGTNYNAVVVRPVTRTRIRDNAVYYDAVQLYSTKRDEFQTKIFDAIEKNLNERGLLLEQILVRNINLPTSVKAKIEDKINAEQESQKMQFVLSKETQEAERKRVEAQGIADYQRIISLNLTDRQLQYEMIKAQMEIAKSPNSKVIILSPGQKTPIILGNQ